MVDFPVLMGTPKPQSRDTDEASELFLIERYRAMAPCEKVQIFRQLCRTRDEFALAGLRERHPGDNALALRIRLATQRLGSDVMGLVFGSAAVNGR